MAGWFGIMKNVRVEVAQIAKSVGHDQVPAIYDQVLGDIFFATCACVNQAAILAARISSRIANSVRSSSFTERGYD